MQRSVEQNGAGEGEVLDVRGMQPPANVLSVLNRVSTLPQGAGLLIRADCNPWQLYDLLQQRGYLLLMEKEQDGSYLGKVTQRNLAELQH